ncbi:hypothetical protein BKA81DRAFT_346825 [Phyllosticta paracitricarpa]
MSPLVRVHKRQGLPCVSPVATPFHPRTSLVLDELRVESSKCRRESENVDQNLNDSGMSRVLQLVWGVAGSSHMTLEHRSTTPVELETEAVPLKSSHLNRIVNEKARRMATSHIESCVRLAGLGRIRYGHLRNNRADFPTRQVRSAPADHGVVVFPAVARSVACCRYRTGQDRTCP